MNSKSLIKELPITGGLVIWRGDEYMLNFLSRVSPLARSGAGHNGHCKEDYTEGITISYDSISAAVSAAEDNHL